MKGLWFAIAIRLPTMTRYIGTILPVYIATALVTVFVGILVVTFVAHPVLVLGFVCGSAAGAITAIFAGRLTTFARNGFPFSFDGNGVKKACGITYSEPERGKEH